MLTGLGAASSTDTATGLRAASSTDTKSSTAVEILATPAWLVVYTLLVNLDTRGSVLRSAKKTSARIPCVNRIGRVSL